MTSGPRISCSFCVVEGGAPAYMTFWKGLLCSILGGACVSFVVAEKLMLSVEVVWIFFWYTFGNEESVKENAKKKIECAFGHVENPHILGRSAIASPGAPGPPAGAKKKKPGGSSC